MKEKASHFLSTVKVDPKGQIVIPKEIRDMFAVGPGDKLIIMADSTRGIALHKEDVFTKVMEAILSGDGKEIYPAETEEDLEGFARANGKTLDNGEAGK
jgi:AbrB family looped-hinge helix DNA binding protein